MKIGFLAMSGVRVHDPELLKLGLTLPGFVDRGKVVASLPSLGLLYLAAVTPRNHEVSYYEAADVGQETPELLNCDVVAISTFSAQVLDAYQIADRLRAAGVTVVMGGLHVSVMPHEAKQHADHVIIGEGENIWPVVIRAIENHEAGRIWNAQEVSSVEIKELPLPRYELLKGREYNRFTVQTSRGCPWRCDFCASSVMLQRKYRKREICDIVRDIDYIQQLFHHPFIEFADDNTFVDKRWGKELCRVLIPRKIKWFTETDITVADDPELLDLMAESGCRQVLIGLESPASKDLDNIELRSNFKARVADRYAASIERIQAHGITVNGCFILGLDHQFADIFQSILGFVNTVGLYEAQVTVLTPFPGTPLYNRLISEHRLIEPQNWRLCTLFDVNYYPLNMSVEELRQGLYWLTKNLYSREAVRVRRKQFFQQIRNTKRNGCFNELTSERHF